MLFLFAAGVFSVGLCAVGTFILPSSCIPALLLIGLWIPWSYIDHRARRRAQRFSEDYPAVLLATASSVQVGLPPHQALERATRLLPAASPARLEVERLLERMRAGVSKEEAISGFAADIDLPDIELFRSAFLLVTETGGRFSPTLQRLASVTNNRMALIQMAAVTTASMRMTANVLLAIAPALVLFLSFRIPGFWDLFRNHPTANLLASLGIVIISVGYLVLRKMSAFKP